MRRVTTLRIAVCLFVAACGATAGVHAQGAVNPALDEPAVRSSCATKGWTKAYRPDPQWTSAYKRQLLREAGLPASAAKDYELDHRIPLCLGGAPTDRANLWLQPWPDATRKDKAEAALCKAVCDGRMSLKDAQAAMAAWTPMHPAVP